MTRSIHNAIISTVLSLSISKLSLCKSIELPYERIVFHTRIVQYKENLPFYVFTSIDVEFSLSLSANQSNHHVLHSTQQHSNTIYNFFHKKNISLSLSLSNLQALSRVKRNKRESQNHNGQPPKFSKFLKL